jgi:adenosylcobinamide kinase / adenosylcobinamide-phosphate guanylyltransferase
MERTEMITFISGGARSGKSSFAEQYSLALFYKKKALGKACSLYYIATAIPSDKEMEKRIGKHINDRTGEWRTIEAPFDLYPVLSNFTHGDIALLDCLTVWLDNNLFGKERNKTQLTDDILNLLKMAKEQRIDLVIVSNDLNEGIPISNSFVCEYIYTLEALHKEIVPLADEVIQVTAGIPMYWKEARK